MEVDHAGGKGTLWRYNGKCGPVSFDWDLHSFLA
jgi:hypothetical protein